MHTILLTAALLTGSPDAPPPQRTYAPGIPYTAPALQAPAAPPAWTAYQTLLERDIYTGDFRVHRGPPAFIIMPAPPVPIYLPVPCADPLYRDDPRDEQDYAYMLLRGDVLFTEGHYQEAARRYAKALLLPEAEGSGHAKLAGALLAVGKYSFAAGALREALDAVPALPRIGTDCRIGYGEIENFDAHLRALAAHLKTHRDDADALAVLGYMLYHSRQLDRAEPVFVEALKHRPGEPIATTYLAVIRAPASQPSEPPPPHMP